MMSSNRPRGNSKVEAPPFDDEQTSERDLLIFQAQICEQSNRYDDMVKVMHKLCRNYGDLSVEERNLLSCAYKNVIGSRRTSWRIINEILEQQQQQQQQHFSTSNNVSVKNALDNNDRTESQDDKQQEQQQQSSSSKDFKYNTLTVKNFLTTIEAELRLHCCNIIDILTERLIPNVASTGESRVFYYKMKGDYIRYLCEITSATSDRKEKSNESLLAYKTACDKAMIELPPTHPVRLGLMLNFSVFYYDIMKSPERSCRLAKQAFDDAIAELDTLSEESYRDSTIIMQLLRDNLNLWESEQSIQMNSNNLEVN